MMPRTDHPGPTLVAADAAGRIIDVPGRLALGRAGDNLAALDPRGCIPLPPGSELTSSPALTSDGRTVAYVARQGTEDARLYLRDLDSVEARAVLGSNGARRPFFSADNKWVAFFAQGH